MAQAFAVTVMGDGEADPAARVAAIHRHAGRTEPGHGNGFAVLAQRLGRWTEIFVRVFRVSCRHFVARGFHGAGPGVNLFKLRLPTPLRMS